MISLGYPDRVSAFGSEFLETDDEEALHCEPNKLALCGCSPTLSIHVPLQMKKKNIGPRLCVPDTEKQRPVQGMPPGKESLAASW